MSELDEEWERRMRLASERARATGRGDVAAYLRLREMNDEARAFGIEWLLETFMRGAGEVNRAGGRLSIEPDNKSAAHRFAVGSATMVGRRLVLRTGVRTLTIEAGHPRLPSDGIVRGGGLAHANVHHFGDAKSNINLLLVRETPDALTWFHFQDNTRGARFTADNARRHLARLMRA